MTLPSDIVFDPEDFEGLWQWCQDNDIRKPWSIEGTTCATAHFKIGDNGEWIPQPQCSDYWVAHEGSENVRIIKGDTLSWTGKYILVYHTGNEDDAPPSYYDSLRVPI